MPQQWELRVKQVLAVLMLVAMALFGGTAPAVAHNELIGSDPPDGATLASGPARVVLTFDLPVKARFSTVTVTGPDRTQWQAGAAVEDGATVSAPLRPLGPAGQYTIAYQVLSADGHPVRGAVRFTLTNPGLGVAADQSQPGALASDSPGSAAHSPATHTGSSDASLWPWLVGVGVLLVAGVVAALRIGRRG
jgi:methionine-rich copper-binding protein CopC